MSTPSFEAVIRAAVEQRLESVNTSLPAKVQSIGADGVVNVLPTVKRKMADGTFRAYPVIPRVPVITLSSGGAWVKLPVQVGDPVALWFCQRSLDRWLASGDMAEAGSVEKFSLKDAFCLPGLRGRANKITPNGAASSLEIAHGSAYIEITDSGAITVTNGNATVKLTAEGKVSIGTSTAELIAQLVALLGQMVTTPNITGVAGFPPTALPVTAQFNPTVLAQLGIIKAKLETLQVS